MHVCSVCNCHLWAGGGVLCTLFFVLFFACFVGGFAMVGSGVLEANIAALVIHAYEALLVFVHNRQVSKIQRPIVR